MGLDPLGSVGLPAQTPHPTPPLIPLDDEEIEVGARRQFAAPNLPRPMMQAGMRRRVASRGTP